jgi:hypothetical protein
LLLLSYNFVALLSLSSQQLQIMPKLTSRCDRRSRFGMHAASVAFMAPPRKVSFEDGHYETSSSSPDTSSSAISVLKEEPAPLMSRKPTLIRPITSLSLVELAQSEIDDEDSNLSSVSLSSHTPVDYFRRTERSECPLTHPSMWGHFVELLVPSWDISDNSTNNKNPHHYHQETCSCCSTCRRRRSSPFGDYFKNKQQRRPLAFLQDDVTTPFRLSPPRKDKSTEKLISGLVRMRVDC